MFLNFKLDDPKWKFTTGLEPHQYRRRICSTGAVLVQSWHKHDLPPVRLQKVTWLEVVHRYWRGTGHRYHASTEICIGSVLALLRSWLLADTWSQDWGCTTCMPEPRQPSARYQLASADIAPFVYNQRGTVPFVNTSMNPTFPPEVEFENLLLSTLSEDHQSSIRQDTFPTGVLVDNFKL